YWRAPLKRPKSSVYRTLTIIRNSVLYIANHDEEGTSGGSVLKRCLFHLRVYSSFFLRLSIYTILSLASFLSSVEQCLTLGLRTTSSLSSSYRCLTSE